MKTLSPAVEEKYAQLQGILRDIGRVAIGFSGGVDSTLLLRVALDTLGGENVLALIGDSDSYPTRELQEAKALAEEMGAPYRVIQSKELDDERYAANPSNRCYYCKSDLFTRCVAIGREHGFSTVLDGNNADDVGDWRPGQKAARELGVRSPLMEIGMSKAEVRELSRALGLRTWDKPAFACLASRIPYGTAITREKLSAVEEAENFLRDLGFAQVRVRHHGEVARIEVAPALIEQLLDHTLRERINSRLRELGFRYVTLDLQGYRMGSMNEVLSGV